MLHDQNRPARLPSGPAWPSPSSDVPRATRVLAEPPKRPEAPPLSIAVLPDLRGLLLVALVAAWLAGILLGSLAALSFWALLILAGTCGVLAFCVRQLGIPQSLRGRARWLTLGLLLLTCAALGAARLALSSPVGDTTAVSAFIGRGTVMIDGEISAAPDLRNRSTLLEVDANSLSLDKGTTWQNVHGTVAVITLGTNSLYAPEYGDTVELTGLLEPVVGSPVAVVAAGASSGSGALKSLQPVDAPAGIFAAMSFPRLSIQERGGGNPLLAWLFDLRQGLAQAISQALPEPEASLLIGIVLGLKTSVLRAQYALFQATGTEHLIVTDGFKVTLLSGLLWALASRLVGRFYKGDVARVLVMAGIVAYVVLGGAEPAALRAAIMGTLLLWPPRFGRTYNMYTALAFAALLMSLWSPYVLWDVDFQFSFLGTLGLALFATPLAGLLGHWLGRVPGGRLSAELLAVTIAAQVTTLPIQVIDFNQVSLIAPLTNLLIVPLLGVLLAVGVLVGVFGLAIPIVGAAVGWACWPLLWVVYQIIARSAALPFASVNIGALDVWLAWLYEIALGVGVAWFLTRPRRIKPIDRPFLTRAQRRHRQRVQARWRLVGAALVIAAAGVVTLATQPDQRLHITWLDVGAGGQAMLIQTPAGHTILLDGGDNPAALEEALGQRLPFWQRSIDLALLTNPRAGHLLGLLDVLGHYQVKQAGDAGMLHPGATYASWRATLDQRGIPYRQLRRGATIQLEPGVALQVLSPGPILSQDSQNEDTNALILRLVSPGLSVLFLGETTSNTLTALAASGVDLHANIMQVALRAGEPPASDAALVDLLPVVQPSLLVVTPASSTARLTGSSVSAAPEPVPTLSVASTGALALTADAAGWWLES